MTGEDADPARTTGEDADPTETTVEGDRTLAALAHASSLFASFLGPILFLILADDDDELVKQNAKNALNFQIVVFVALVISGLLTVVLVGFLLLPIIGVIDLVLVLIATVKANDGEVYKYPYTPDII
ncbi:DUF4870 domain-containing protein [Halorubrum sp. HHNYT27]|uniref:DUF4870 domain-containing protein n=1 Tax=Halorubrum sp. HHNYT27 TaxID=3402275 RepID=UPI003EBDC1F5